MGLLPAGRVVVAAVLGCAVWATSASAATMTISPGVPAPGTKLTIAGEGLPARAHGAVRLEGRRPIGFRVDGKGQARVTVTVPPSAKPGKRRMLRLRAGRRLLQTPVTVVRSARQLSTLSAHSRGHRVVLNPTEVNVGGRLRLTGSGFGTRAAVAVRLGGTALARVRANRRGRFTFASVVPAMSQGPQPLRVSSGGVRLHLTVVVSVPVPAGPPAAGQPAPSPPPPPPRTVVAAGDIACAPNDPNFNAGAGAPGFCQHQATSDLAISIGAAAVLGLGDLQYNAGELRHFQAVYAPTWGRLDPLMFPVPGNHEYGTPGAAGYFSYFGARAGPAGRGYYSFDVGSWHVVALNSNCSIVPCVAGSPQDQWLRADLAAHPSACTLAFFHHALFGSGQGTGDEAVHPLWDALHAAGADVIVNGHSHDYERMAPMNPAGAADPAQGIRQFTVGTGGEDLQPFRPGIAPNTEARSSDSFGVLVLNLRAGGYDWRFVPTAGGAFSDAGSGNCH